MSSKFVHTIFATLVLWMCSSHGTGLQLPENTATMLRRPMKFIKSSLDASGFGTGVSKGERGTNVRTVEDIRSPTSIGVNFYRLPPSPANLLKPDGFQFYTYNERGDMITRQMTMQEIQALIAGGGPDHSNIAIQEPQKVEDTLTGGKKVIDVVEKVQSVLKSAMDKPLSTLTGPHPTIPEKANVEWSNILPAILGGDKYGSKVEEHQYVEESTTVKPTATRPVQNVSFSAESEENVSDGVSRVTFEQLDGTQSEKNGSHVASSPFPEKIMIPVHVITTEQVAQHTTESYNWNQTTETVSSVSNNRYEHRNHSTEKDSATTNAYDTKWTTVGSYFSPTTDAVKSNFVNALSPNVSADGNTRETQANKTMPIGEVDGPLKVHASSSPVSKEPAQYSTESSFPYASTSNRDTGGIHDSSTFGYSTVTKESDLVATTQRLKPASAETDSLEQVVSEGQTTRSPVATYKDEGTTVGKDMLEGNVGNSFGETTTKLAFDGETFSSASSSTPIVEKRITNYSESLTQPAIDRTSNNGPSGIAMTTPTPFESPGVDSSKPVVGIVDSILRTVSTEVAPASTSEPITIPHTLSSAFSANTFASALIAGFDNQNVGKTQTVHENASISSLDSLRKKNGTKETPLVHNSEWSDTTATASTDRSQAANEGSTKNDDTIATNVSTTERSKGEQGNVEVQHRITGVSATAEEFGSNVTDSLATGNSSLGNYVGDYQSEADGTNITSLQHTWQRISLHQTSSSVGTKEQDIPVSTEESAVNLEESKSSGGLDVSIGKASNDIVNFSKLCNELAIKFWIATNKGLSTGRSLALSPFGMISLLAMIFLGARGSTSDEMNEVLGLDNVATFNPHLIFQNVTDTVSLARHQGIANAAFVRELFADKGKIRKLLPFYKEQAQQFYEGLVAEVNFATIGDLARRRTNLLVRKQTGGRIKDFAKSNAVPLRSPLAAISANVFETDCNASSASATGRDGELYFAVSSGERSRKLIPVPATVWRSNVLAGYEPGLDATAIAIGGIDKLVSTIFLVPGQQGHVAPGDTLDRLEQRFVKGAFRDGGWHKVLKVLVPRPGLELQLPKFSHRSVVNATAALKRMGLEGLFSEGADLKGINGIGNRVFLSDVFQMNLFGTCGEENVGSGRRHAEVYPGSGQSREIYRRSSSGRSDREMRGEKPRLRLDQPFLYFARHNPSGLILHMGRFDPRLS